MRNSKTAFLRRAMAFGCLSALLALLVESCASQPDPRLMRRRRPAPGAQAAGEGQEGGSQPGYRQPSPGSRPVEGGADRPARMSEAAGVAEVEVLDEADRGAAYEIVEEGLAGASAEEIAERRRREEEARLAKEAAEIARLQKELEQRQKEEAEAKLRARQEAARREEEQTARSSEAQGQRAAAEAALADLGGEGVGEDLESLKRRIDAKKTFLDRFSKGSSAASKSSVIPTTMHSLADLHVRYANEDFLRRMSAFERNEEACKQGKAGCKPDMDFPLKDFTAAIGLYKQLLEEYPGRADNDKVLYQLSFAYQEMGEMDEAEQVLLHFLKANPEDQRSQAAWFRLGLSYVERTAGLDIFDAMPWLNKAVDAFQNALKFSSDTYYYNQSLFQLGWATFRLNEFGKTVEWMDKLVRKVVEDAKKKGEFKRFDDLYEESAGLMREAIKFMAIAWSEMGDAKSGPENLEKFWKKAPPGPHEQYTYIALGEFYEKEERYREAIDVYQKMVQKFPTYSAVPRVLELVVTVYEKDKKWTEVNEARAEIVRRLSPAGDWWKANGPDVRQQAAEIRARAVFQLAQYHHAKAQQKDTKNPGENFKLAADNYKLFLTDYPESKDAPEALYLLAEVYFSTADYAAAATAYEKVAWETGHEKRKETAAYKSVVAWQDGLDEQLEEVQKKYESEGKTFERSFGLKASKFTPKLITAIDRFVKVYPAHEKVADLLFNEGEILYTTKQYGRARDVYRGVIERFPKDPRSQEAQEYIATTYLEAGDQKAAETEYRKALAMVPVKETEKRTKLRTLIAAAVYKQGEQLKEKGDLIGAADSFLSVPRDPELRDVEIAPTAFFDAGIAYKDAGRWDLAIPVFQDLPKQYPDSEFGPKGLALVGTYYRDQKKLPEAAQTFIAASALFEKQGDKEKAEDLYYISGKMYEELHDWDRALETMRNYTKKFGAKPKRIIEAKYIEGYAAYERKDYNQAGRIWDELVVLYNKYKKDDPEVPAVFPAKARFTMAQRAFDDYAAVQLTLPLKRSLKSKQQMLTKMITAYGEVAQFKVEEYTTASTFQIGLALLNFRDAILNSERPKEVLKDEILAEEYGFALEEQAFPFEEKAIQTFQQNVVYSRKNQAFNEWIAKSFERLAKIVPGRWAKAELGEQLTCQTISFARGAASPKPEVQPKSKPEAAPKPPPEPAAPAPAAAAPSVSPAAAPVKAPVKEPVQAPAKSAAKPAKGGAK